MIIKFVVMDPILYFMSLFEKFTNKPTEEVEFVRGELLSKPGQIENYLYLILDGSVRAYYISENEEHTLRFGYKNSIISALDSFITGRPSAYYLEALKKTSAKRIPKTEYLAFINSSTEIQQMYMQLLNELVVAQLDREIDILTTSPSERYRRVLKRSPQLFQEIPLKYIAAYLRMTPETLSRLRKTIS